jgi:hypothetical protein
MEHKRVPLAFGKIHGGDATVLHGSGQLSPTPVQHPLYPGGTLSHSSDRAPPTLVAMVLPAPISHHHRQAKPGANGTGGGGARTRH